MQFNIHFVLVRWFEGALNCDDYVNAHVEWTNRIETDDPMSRPLKLTQRHFFIQPVLDH